MVNGSNEAFNARHRTGFSQPVGRKG